MQILKLGGSVITLKEMPMTANLDNIKHLCEEIRAVWPTPLVIVHGGGSFGHPVAQKYDLTNGLKSSRQIVGFVKTHQAMVSLNNIIVNAFIEAGLPAISIAPSSFIMTDQNRITSVDFSIIGRLVVNGILPILYGDVVLDLSKGFCILSGDQIAVRLATELHASRLIFGVDVNGVFTSNPKLVSQSRLIGRLSLDKLDDYIEIGKALTTDVTGGMLGKVIEAKAAVKAGVEVKIVNANRKDVIFKAIRGDSVTGTILTR
jgi:isopentenyl phosphate kinase